MYFIFQMGAAPRAVWPPFGLDPLASRVDTSNFLSSSRNQLGFRPGVGNGFRMGSFHLKDLFHRVLRLAILA